MQLRNGMTQERQRGVPTRTNFRLEGFWLYVVRGAWISFVLVELLVLQRDFLGYTERKSLPGGETRCLLCVISPPTSRLQ
jgi:hypothetical protein